MDTNTIIWILSGITAIAIYYAYVAHHKLEKKEIENKIDEIYVSISEMRDDLWKESEKINNKIDKEVEIIYNEMRNENNKKFHAFSQSINDLYREIDNMGNKQKEPSLYDNVP